MENTNTNWKVFGVYLLVVLLVMWVGVANGQIVVTEFNAEWNAANKVAWVDKLSDCDKMEDGTEEKSPRCNYNSWDGKFNGKFDAYEIPNNLVYNHQVSRTQTFRQQQQEGRRPRFSVEKEIIRKNGIKPLKTCQL